MSKQPTSPAAPVAADQTAEPDPKRPVVRLKPKTGGRFFAGAPWVYANELVLDRRTKALSPGSIATLEDSARTPLATVAVTPGSTIAARQLDPDPAAEIDADWLSARLSAAKALRDRLGDPSVYRWAHAEADGLPGLVIDRFDRAVVVQPNAAWVETRRAALLAAIDRTADPDVIVWSGGSRARALEGLPEVLRVLKGALDGPAPVTMNGATYLADLAGGQKTGLYLDQRPTHAFVAALAATRSVLDVFSHVGGFSLAALAAGAARAVAVDGSEAALRLAQAGADRSGVAERFETRRADAFDALRAIVAGEERFDVVICDPPAFAPNKAALEQGARAYAKLARLGVAATARQGVFALCSCSHAMSVEALKDAAAAAFRAARREARLLREGGAGPDHPIHPHLPETGYLKTLVYALD